MKYFVALFIVILATQSASEDEVSDPLENLLKSMVNNHVSGVFRHITNLVETLTPAETCVSIPVLVSTLKAVPNTTLMAVNAAFLSLADLDLDPLLEELPSSVKDLPINISDFEVFLDKSVPGDSVQSFSTFANIFYNYLSNYFTTMLTNVLNWQNKSWSKNKTASTWFITLRAMTYRKYEHFSCAHKAIPDILYIVRSTKYYLVELLDINAFIYLYIIISQFKTNSKNKLIQNPPSTGDSNPVMKEAVSSIRYSAY